MAGLGINLAGPETQQGCSSGVIGDGCPRVIDVPWMNVPSANPLPATLGGVRARPANPGSVYAVRGGPLGMAGRAREHVVQSS